jgi:hypothetical protein
MRASLCVMMLIVGGILSACSDTAIQTEPSTILPQRDDSKGRIALLTVPSFPTNAYAGVYMLKTSGASSLAWTGIDTLVGYDITVPETPYISASYGIYDAATVSINATNLTKSGPNYVSTAASLNVVGGNNLVTTTIGGNTYYDTIAAHVGVTSFSPTYEDTVSKSGFTITWSTSTYSNDYVEVCLTEKNADTGSTTHAVRKYLVDDTGSLSISSSDLAAFDAGAMMEIRIARGMFATKTHGGNDYVYVLVSEKFRDVFVKN